MSVLERIFLVTDALFPAKRPRWELEKIRQNIEFLIPEMKTLAVVAPRHSYLRRMRPLPPHTQVLDIEWPAANTPASAEEIGRDQSIDTLLIDISASDAAQLLEDMSANGTLSCLKVVVTPVAFQERYAGKPYYAAVTALVGRHGYSLFNLYNVAWKRGQIRTAYALYIDRKLRGDFVRKIQV
ncbi:MAG: hypothetical protein KGJ31_01380 [Patescibacteria group bacterium]|nr:hypothetical protein [Patescibacteria group bacterium]